METILSIICVIAMVVIGRLAGDSRGFGKGAEQVVLGGIIALLVALQTGIYSPYIWLCITATFVVGVSIGWPNTMGSVLGLPGTIPPLKRWQVGILKKPWPALIARSLMFGSPCLAVYYWQPAVVAILAAYAIAFLLALIIAGQVSNQAVYETTFVRSKWELQEALRHLIAGIIMMVIL